MGEISCRQIISTASEESLSAMYESVTKQRLARKHNDIVTIYERFYKDWNQTCYQILFKMMDVGANKQAYNQLAEAVPYRYVLREVTSLHSIEAMLLGGSGLLTLYPEDEYISKLKDEWNHLARKYNLFPMRCKSWNLSQTRPYNHPVLRLAQLAQLLHSKEFLVNRIVNCRTADDVVDLFSVEASEYWKDHFVPATQSRGIPKRIGKAKCLILGINLVVPMQIAYSENIGQHMLKPYAMNLLRSIEAEDNRYIRKWQQLGLQPANALQSQAIIQIETEYCQKSRCDECPIIQMGKQNQSL